MEKEPITVNGLEKLKQELIFLKEKKRPEIVAAIAEARSHGCLLYTSPSPRDPNRSRMPSSA